MNLGLLDRICYWHISGSDLHVVVPEQESERMVSSKTAVLVALSNVAVKILRTS